jgi:hypothetical protein
MAIITLRVLPNARLRGQRKCLLLRYLQSGAEGREYPCLFFAYPVHRPHPSKPGVQGTEWRPNGGTVEYTITPQPVQRRALDRQDCEWAGDAGSCYQPVLAQSSLDMTFPTDCAHRSVTRSDRVVNSAKGSNPNHRQMLDTRGAQSSLVNPRSAFPLRRCSRHPIAGRTNGLCKHYRAMHLIGRAA